MTDSPAHRALVTAPFRGEGLDDARAASPTSCSTPGSTTARSASTTASSSRARVEAEGADILIVESDFVKGPVLDLPLRRDRLVPRRPQQRRHRPAPPPRASRCCGPRAATPTRSPSSPSALLFAVNRGVVRADLDVREGQVYRDGTIPYQRYRAWQLAGPDRRHRRARRGRPGDQVAARGARHARHRVRPVRPRRHALARRPARRVRRRLDARAGDARDRRD